MGLKRRKNGRRRGARARHGSKSSENKKGPDVAGAKGGWLRPRQLDLTSA